MLKVSIITVCLNASKTIESTITSVLNQSYYNIQYIIIDGYSNDNTLDIINNFKNRISIFISEPDNGLYDAINKGIALADGDVVGILNADDIFYNDSTVENIIKYFENDLNTMSVFGDIAFRNEKNKIIRNYSSKFWSPFLFKLGVMPPHPSFYCRKEIFFKYGNYRTDFIIASDFEILLRFFVINKISHVNMHNIIVLMTPGGLSTKSWLSQKTITNEIIKACNLNGIYTNRILVSLRYLIKVFQYFPNIKSKQS